MLLFCQCGRSDFFQPQLSIPHAAEHLYRKSVTNLMPTAYDFGYNDPQYYNENCVKIFWALHPASLCEAFSDHELEFLNGCLSLITSNPERYLNGKR